MASHGAIAAAVIGAVATVTAAVLAFVLPNVLDDKGPGGGGPGTIIQDPRGEAELFANKLSAPVGATVQVSGRGFGAGETVEILIGADLVGTTRAGPGGDFANVSVKVPDFFKPFRKPMDVDIHAAGNSSARSARLAFTIS